MATVEDNQPPHEKERETEDNTRTPITTTTSTTTTTTTAAGGNSVVSSSMSRKEKRKALKKVKRKQLRREIAEKAKQEEEARLNDPEEQLKMLKLEEEEAERMAKDRAEYEEREREFLRALEVKKKLMEEEDEARRKLLEEEPQNHLDNDDLNEDDEWDYIEEGPAEIIWKGNEIIVKKKKIRVPKKVPDVQKEKQESERPISNPLAPQSEAYEDYRSAQEVLESVAQQVPNFGTEQDKAHCPFHLKTGVCRFGARCSRVHFYPDKACTILIKNMYNGPGLAWEQDEGLEHTDEEVQRSFEDFYEDVHTEFLKFGEIVNFKVCKNGSSHLRGNVYVHYKSLESAVLAYQSINGRYFAGKLLTCEFVSLTRWRVAICGEFMKSRLKTCSRGSACNFLHCFCNPGGDYEWADWDKPAPRYWLKKMAALFGYTSDGYTDELSPGCHSRRSRSRVLDSPHRKIFSDEDIGHKRNNFRRYRSEGKKTYQDYRSVKHRETYHDDVSDESTDGHGLKRKKRREPESMRSDIKSGNVESIDAKDESVERRASDRYMEYRSRSSSRRKRLPDSVHDHHKVLNLDQEDSSYAYKHHDTELRHKGERYSERRKEADSSNDDSFGDSHDSDESGHHRHSRKYLRKLENEVEKYSRASDESKHVRVDKREQNNRKERSRLKNKENASEIKCSGNSQDTHGTKKHRCSEKSSRGMKHTSGSADGGCRLGKDEKRRQKNESKSKRLKSQSDFTDTESDLDEHTHQRHSKKHSRNVKNDAESSDTTFDGDNLRNYEKRRHKSRSSHSKEKPEMKRNKVRSDEDERHHGHRRSANNPCLSKDDSVRRDGEASGAEKVETCVAHSSCQDSGEADADLEKAYRQAALMKLEDIRKNKDSQAAPSKDSIESPKMCVHENNVGRGVILETPGSIISKTSVASSKRKRI